MGRNLSKLIIIDNIADNFQLQPDNGICIKTWTGDKKDDALKELIPLLLEISKKKVNDVREALKKYKTQMIKQINMGIIKDIK